MAILLDSPPDFQTRLLVSTDRAELVGENRCRHVTD